MLGNFIITVKHGDKPLAGVTVEITTNGDGDSTKSFSAVTASDGTVHVTKLAPGDYWINAELLGVSAAFRCFHVGSRPSRNAARALNFEWGDHAPATRRIAGKLVDSQPGTSGSPIWNLVHRIEVPIVGARLTLQNPMVSATHRTLSDAKGEFAFDGIPPGTYVLHIYEGQVPGWDYDSTDLLIELNPRASRNTILVTRREAGGGSCGGHYLELGTAEQFQPRP